MPYAGPGPLSFFTAWQDLRELLGAPWPWAAIERVALELAFYPVLTGPCVHGIIDNAMELREREHRFFTHGLSWRRECVAAGIPTLRDRLEGIIGPKTGASDFLTSSTKRNVA